MSWHRGVELRRAAAENDLPALMAVLDQSIDIDVDESDRVSACDADAAGSPPLAAEACGWSVEFAATVQVLGFTALHRAALNGHKEAVGLLLVAGANVQQRNGAGKNARDLANAMLHAAAAGSGPEAHQLQETVDLLAAAGIDNVLAGPLVLEC